MNLEKYKVLFVDEATDHLVEMSRALAILEGNASSEDAAEAIDTLFRMAHSIKGMAASLDYDSISALSHQLEDWLEPARELGRVPADGLRLLFGSVRALEEMVTAVEESGESPAPREDLAYWLSQPIQFGRNEITEAATQMSASEPSAPPLPPSVRVRTTVIDRFLASVGEMLQRQARLEAIHKDAPVWERHREFDEELEGMTRVVRDLRRRALEIRTTPVQRVLERLPRVASELAHELGKSVRVELRGEEVEVDRAVLDHLGEPLLHLVRNSMDHGIEAPETRISAGKDAVGTIRISAATVSGRLELSLDDDGGGVDIERLREQAIESGRLPAEVAEDLPPDRICELIFEPGLSTRDEVTTVSGRGVGLDAVKRTIEGLGGTIRVSSNFGLGTRFDLELPSMAALQHVLILEVGSERIAIPLSRVEAVLGIDEGLVEQMGTEAFFVWKEEPLPLLDLGERVGLSKAVTDKLGCVVVVEVRGFQFGLHVDRAAAHLEVFVRDVPSALASIDPLAGVAVLPDGTPVFVLEVAALVEDFL